MNALDENIPDDQRLLLAKQRMRFNHIGQEIGRLGMDDEEIIPLLHRLGPVTFFTLDEDFYRRRLCHARYCLVYLDVQDNEAANSIRQFLRHPAFNTLAKRMGKVVRVARVRLQVWRLHAEKEEELMWAAL